MPIFNFKWKARIDNNDAEVIMKVDARLIFIPVVSKYNFAIFHTPDSMKGHTTDKYTIMNVETGITLSHTVYPAYKVDRSTKAKTLLATMEYIKSNDARKLNKAIRESIKSAGLVNDIKCVLLSQSAYYTKNKKPVLC